jgi:peptidoglycan/LPS O-acetylase OafA/YrhL
MTSPVREIDRLSPYGAATAKGHGFQIPSLDGIRAVAFLIVFISHVPIGTFVPGGFGVTIFFFLSGYLITTLLRIEFDTTGVISLRDFYLRRVLRIFPPMYLALGIATIISFALKHAMSTSMVLAQAAHMTNYALIYHGEHGMPIGMKILWSLAIEEHFYLAFPLVFQWMSRAVVSRQRQAKLLLLICLVVLLWRCVLLFVLHVPAVRISHASDTRIDSILFGSALALGFNPMLDKIAIPPARLATMCLAALAVILGTIIPRSDAFRETIRYTIQGLALAPLFIGAIVLHNRWPISLLSLRWLKAIGLISYMLYLVHLCVVEALPRIGVHNKFVLTATAFIVSIAIATITYFVIEKPASRLRKKLSHIIAAPGQ